MYVHNSSSNFSLLIHIDNHEIPINRATIMLKIIWTIVLNYDFIDMKYLIRKGEGEGQFELKGVQKT